MKPPVKLVAFSDSHGDFDVLVEIVEQERDAAAFCFAGDGYREFQILTKLYIEDGYQFFGVCGNNEPPGFGPLLQEFCLAGMHIRLCHGHLQRVKLGRSQLMVEAAKHGDNLVVYGHTHTAKMEEYGGITLVNPGCCNRRISYHPGYARIFLGEEIKVEQVML